MEIPLGEPDRCTGYPHGYRIEVHREEATVHIPAACWMPRYFIHLDVAFCYMAASRPGASLVVRPGPLFAMDSVRFVTERVTMIFSKRLRCQEHSRAFVVDEANDLGWEVREEADHEVVRRTWMQDWHHVENAMRKFAVEAMQLQRAGWTESPAP
jgi:hypothetical protein